MAENEQEPMSRERAIELLTRGKVETWNKHRKAHPKWIPEVRANDGPVELSTAQLDGINLGGAHLEFVNLHKASVCNANLRGASLVFSNLGGAQLCETDLRNANLGQADLSGAFLDNADLEGATLYGANLNSAVLNDVRLVGTRGLFGPGRAQNMHTVRYAEKAVFARKHDKVPWSSPFLRSIGTLRLFGISNAAWIGIILYAAGVRWYNRGLGAIQSWAEQFGKTEAVEQVAWIQQLPSMPASPWLGWQLIMLVILAIGATLYLALCPDLVKENTETRWTRELEAPLIEYRSAMYSRIVGRYVCLGCYVVGGGYTLGYLAVRVGVAVKTLIF